MVSEAKRGLIRMAANYTRLFGGLVLGLVLVRLLLRGVGNDGYGLIALLGSSVGLSAMLQEVVRRSMIRELSAAYHGGDDEHFRRMYNAALALSAGVAVLTVLAFGLLLALLPLLKIPDALLPAARWFVVAKAVELFFSIVNAAPFAMYLVVERMAAYNVWLLCRRAGYVAAAAWVVFATGSGSIATGIIVYGALSSGLVVGTALLATAWIMSRDRRLVPAPALVTREAIASITRVGGWYASVVLAMNLHLRLGALIMNLALGVFGNTIFGLAMTLTSYVRMLATGMTTGLDAVAGRLSTTADDSAVRRLVYHGTRLHGLVTFPALLIVVVLAQPLLELWVGARVEQPETTLPPTFVLVRILVLGTAVRSVSDGWITMLYGAGHIRRYAPAVIIGGVLDPLLAVVLLAVLPAHLRYTAVAWAFAAVMLVVHGVVIPWIGARTLRIGVLEMVSPLLRPLLMAAAGSPILLLAQRYITTWTFFDLLIVITLYGAACAVLTVVFVMNAGERKRVARAVAARLRASS